MERSLPWTVDNWRKESVIKTENTRKRTREFNLLSDGMLDLELTTDALSIDYAGDYTGWTPIVVSQYNMCLD